MGKNSFGDIDRLDERKKPWDGGRVSSPVAVLCKDVSAAAAGGQAVLILFGWHARAFRVDSPISRVWR
jgi:hypothetical protein